MKIIRRMSTDWQEEWMCGLNAERVKEKGEREVGREDVEEGEEVEELAEWEGNPSILWRFV